MKVFKRIGIVAVAAFVVCMTMACSLGNPMIGTKWVYKLMGVEAAKLEFTDNDSFSMSIMDDVDTFTYVTYNGSYTYDSGTVYMTYNGDTAKGTVDGDELVIEGMTFIKQ